MPNVVLPDARRQLRSLVLERLGIAPSPTHEYRVDRALERLMSVKETASPSAAHAALASLAYQTPPWQLVIDALVVGETRFFRQSPWFSQLEQHVLTPIVEQRLRTGTKRLRLWSAACATGEETYTLVIMLHRLLGSNADWDIRVIGTDINARFLADARRAIYREWSLREVDPGTRSRYFRELGSGQFEVAAPIREMVTFRTLNLIGSAAPGEDLDLADVDLIVCRNMLMYLTPAYQQDVARRLVAAVAPNGWLAVAPAEATAEWFRPLVPLNVPSAIFFHHPVAPNAAQQTAPRPIAQRAPNSIRPRAQPAKNAALGIAKSAGTGGADEIGRIRVLLNCGDLDTARGRCEAFLVDDSLSYAANLLLALICEELDDMPSALAAAKRATYLEPQSAAAHFLSATALARLGRTPDARRKMEIVVQLLDSGAPTRFDSWDVSVDRLRKAAVDYLDGMTLANARSTVG